MTLTPTLAVELKRLTPHQRVALADYIWRAEEETLGPTEAQLAELDRRAEEALKNPKKLRSPRELVKRIRR